MGSTARPWASGQAEALELTWLLRCFRCFRVLGALAKHLHFIRMELGLWEQGSRAEALSVLESQFG